MSKIFDKQTLLDEIIKTWGEHGAHAEVYKQLIAECQHTQSLQEGEAVEVLSWLLEQSDLGKLTMNDGLFFYEEDKDGDQPLEAEDIFKLFKQRK